MTRKIWFAICVSFIVAVRIHQHLTGNAVDVGMMLEPLLVLWSAFVVPAALPVMLIERYVFHLDPWADGNDTRSAIWLTLTASFLWFFPADRIARWFGRFDAFKHSDRPRPRLLGAAVFVYEQANKRLFGRQKTGGWA